MHAIVLKNLHKTYSGGIEALKGINLEIKQGDFFALLGANGAGKSTTIGLISTLLTITSGSILICGINLSKNPSRAKRCLGIVPQEINLNVFESCYRILVNQAGYYGIPRRKAKSRACELLKQLGLWEKRNTISRKLSGGMKRRLMIARALMHEPKVLILDEPTAGVDIEIRRSMWDFLQKINAGGTTIILTTHYLEEAEQLCKHIAIIDKGELIKNTSTQTLLKNLSHQTYILTTKQAFKALPKDLPFNALRIDDHTIEVKICDETQGALNQMFEYFNENRIQITSLRNKTNRLEELFMELIKK